MSSPKRRIETDVSLPVLSKSTEVPAATNVGFVITIGHEVCLMIQMLFWKQRSILIAIYRMYASDSSPTAYATARKCPIDYYTTLEMGRLFSDLLSQVDE